MFAVGLALVVASTPALAAGPQITKISLVGIDPTTPLYKIPVLIYLSGVECPASVTVSVGKISLPLVRTTSDVCAAGETAPDTTLVHLPVFDTTTGAYALPGQVNDITAVVNGTSGAKSIDSPLPPRPYWIGVGDSYSSGHHQDKSDLKGAACHIDMFQGGVITVNEQLQADNNSCNTTPNDDSFSWVTRATDRLNSALGVPEPWRMKAQVLARSGAASEEFTKTFSEYDHGQVSQMINLASEVATSWNVVSVTGGANDGSYTFARALQDYYTQASTSQGFLGIGRIPHEPWKAKWPNCPNIEKLYQNAQRELPNIQTALQNVLDTAHSTSPGVRTVDVGYPYILPTNDSCAVDHGSSHGATATIDLLDGMHKSIGHIGDYHVDPRQALTFGDIQKTLFLGYPHATSSGQEKIADAAVAMLK